jgi:hypothetical protein
MLQVGTDPKGRAAGKRLWFSVWNALPLCNSRTQSHGCIQGHLWIPYFLTHDNGS